MDFRYKSGLQSLFSVLPHGDTLNYLFQRRVSRSLPIGEKRLRDKIATAQYHLDTFRTFSRVGDPGVYYEFGAGWDLIIPLILALGGNFRELRLVDIRKLARAELIIDALRRLDGLRSSLPFPAPDFKAPEPRGLDLQAFLKEKLRIDYLAPADAKATGFAPESIDFVSSTSTFEHLPEAEIPPILRELYRILKPGGVVSIIVDHRDHWSYFDRNISVYNFLAYSERAWTRYNPSLHFQNRLRAVDYSNMFAQTSFELVRSHHEQPSEAEAGALSRLALDERFRLDYAFEDLAVKSSRFVLRKSGKHTRENYEI